MSQLTASNFQAYDPTDASGILPGPTALYSVSVDSLAPTQLNEGLTEVGKKAAAFDLETQAQLQASLLTDIEPVVIGPDGKLYLTDGHHTFTALEDSIYGASNPTVYVNVIANYSNLTEAQFFATMQANNLLLPLNDGVPETVNDATGAPIPTSLTNLTSDVYRGLEYSILKNKSSKLFTATNNLTGAKGASTPGLDKMTGFYSDFLEAAAYRDANGGLGLAYLSPVDIAIATNWNLNPNSTTTLPNISGIVHAYQLPGFILAGSIVNSGGISNATLANGAMDGNGTFTGITTINAGTAANPITIGTPNTGFIMQLGADKLFTVTLNGTNTYTGGTSILAGTLIIANDASLGAATPAGATVDPANVKSSVQGDNGIIFNSLSEGNATLQIGTASGAGTATFSTNRPIAVGGEAATLNVNGYKVTLTGQLVSLGVGPDNVGIGNATGYSDFTIDDNSSNKGILYLTTPSPYFYGNLVIGNANKPTVNVTNDLAMGNTLANNANEPVGQVELNGGTLQTGASFSATDRNIFLGGGSKLDVDGNTTSWGSLSDTQRVMTITNSSTATAGAVTFSSFNIASTASLVLTGGTLGETVTFTNGIERSSAATLIIQPTSSTSLGTTDKLLAGTGAAPLVNGIAQAWIVTNNGVASSAGPYDFVTYGANGYVKASYTSVLSASTGSNVVALGGNTTLNGSAAAYALNTESKNLTIGAGNTLTIGDGTAADAAGLILGTGNISSGTLAFGGSEGVIWLGGTGGTISSTITGSDGLTFSGAGGVSLSTAANISGTITIDSGNVTLTGANVFAGDASGVLLQDTKSTPSTASLTINANNQFAALNSAGNNSTIAIGSGDILTIGDSHNLSSTLSSTITESGSATAGAITKAGTGLLDLSGATITLIAGSSIAVNGGELRIAASVLKTAASNFVLSNGADLQFAQSGGGQYAGAISGSGTLHLIGGTLQLVEGTVQGTNDYTAVSNTYTGGTIVETGSTLDITTASLPTINENITDAGGLIVFDQNTAGTFTGVISDGNEMGVGPLLSGSLDIDNSAATTVNGVLTPSFGNNITIANVQTYTGATYIEAGTLTLGATNAIAASSGLTLGRVGTSTTATLALGANNSLQSLSSDASGTGVVETTSVLLNGHVLTLTPATGVSSAFGGVITDGSAAGSVVIDGSGTTTFTGTNTYTGGTTIELGTLELGNAQAAGTGAITFQNAPQVDPTLQIDGTTMPTNIIDGFGSGDVIDLANIANQSGSSADFNYTTDVLTITEGSSNYQLKFDPSQNFQNEYFHLISDGANGTDVSESSVACYCPGTLILTDTGEVAAESLAIGDLVVTASGIGRPIKWIGRRSYGGRFLKNQKTLLPICIKAGAIADLVPRRDLWISPHHAMFIDGVLIEAKDLVNGVSVVQAEQRERVDYIHIELDTHDVIIAEGAFSESFVDDESRGMFHNAHEFAELYPDAQRELAIYCAPRVEQGAALEKVQRDIARRAGLATVLPESFGTLRGHLDYADHDLIKGWAQCPEHPSAPVCLDILVDGVLVAQTLANIYRADLAEIGMGTGRHGFAAALPATLSPDVAHVIEVRRSLDGLALRQSPCVLEEKRSAA